MLNRCNQIAQVIRLTRLEPSYIADVMVDSFLQLKMVSTTVDGHKTDLLGPGQRRLEEDL